MSLCVVRLTCLASATIYFNILLQVVRLFFMAHAGAIGYSLVAAVYFISDGFYVPYEYAVTGKNSMLLRVISWGLP
jgi:hypothetical protein